MTTAYHKAVLLKESISALITDRSGVYVDATFGGGGHSAAILSHLNQGAHLLAIDKDSDALKNVIEDKRLSLFHGNFRFVNNFVSFYAKEKGIRASVDGILADLGVSSHQFDTAERGFSFRFDADLDMRMNTKAKLKASDVINSYESKELENIFRLYAEVGNPGKVAQLIVNGRRKEAITSTAQLNDTLKSLLPKNEEHKYLAKIYQALRIEVNQEMSVLESFLAGASKSLKEGGHLVVISYHSLEDRIVKNFIKSGNIKGELKRDIYGNCVANSLKALNRKPIMPKEDEISLNTRARSAKLRVAVKSN